MYYCQSMSMSINISKTASPHLLKYQLVHKTQSAILLLPIALTVYLFTVILIGNSLPIIYFYKLVIERQSLVLWLIKLVKYLIFSGIVTTFFLN